MLDPTADPVTVGSRILLPDLKVTIAWFDPPFVISSVKKLLVHDIDLLILDPRGDVYLGNIPKVSSESTASSSGFTTKSKLESIEDEFVSTSTEGSTARYYMF